MFATALLLTAVLTQERVGPRLEVEIDPLTDLVFFVRAAAAGVVEPPRQTELQAAVAAARTLDRQLGHPLLWGEIDARLEGAGDAQSWCEALESLPEQQVLLGGARVQLRAEAGKFADSILAAEESFFEHVWPEHERLLEKRLTEWEDRFRPHETAGWEQVTEALEFEALAIDVPVYLVAVGPPPGGITYHRSGTTGTRNRRSQGVCFVAVRDAPGTQLDETILHEAIHACDATTESQGSLLTHLRTELENAGLSPRSPHHRNLWHTVLFVQAAETIRRVISPDHQAYGDVSGYYSRVGEPSIALVTLWPRYLDGELDRDDLVRELIKSL